MKKFQKGEAFTGLEAAIVLIAFVVVAAVFSYVVLGAGFFTTQQAQKVVYSGIGQASSNIVVVGEVYGDASGTAQSGNNPGSIHTLVFTIALAAGGTPIDLNQTVFVYQNATTLQTLDFASNISGNGAFPPVTQTSGWQWMITKIANGNSNTMLEPNEQFTIQANVSADPPTPSNGIPPSDQFTLQIRPPVGAAVPITKSAPGGITNWNLLY
jgi:flagellin FlaB